MSDTFAVQPATRVRRHPERASYERDAVHALLDAHWVCQIAFVHEGRPHVLPTSYWRGGDLADPVRVEQGMHRVALVAGALGMAADAGGGLDSEDVGHGAGNWRSRGRGPTIARRWPHGWRHIQTFHGATHGPATAHRLAPSAARGAL